ncbi:hypothetical protein [Tenacibaculum sp. IB213877]|uniref:coiled-coil domain-containing protein n=1 Tax=Tenacibaculum sp. IB213877 TaxID=3097351 RepID=UPI002A5AAF83|nr:hypothetical protein [Tenacibaculum sp. IB213877]MDY0780621.1 hypothetical protein [Tenacibaculum sp. IB213877]
MNESPKKKDGLKYLLVGLLIILLFYAYKKNDDYVKLENAFVEEKLALQQELDEIINDYKDLSVKKKELSKRLIKEVNKIIALRDSVKNLKTNNFKLIRKYRRQVATLERQNRILFNKVDSLNILNKELEDAKKAVTNELNLQDSITKQLAAKNDSLLKYAQELQAKINYAGALKVENIDVTAMKERSSGRLTTTSRSNRTDAFKVNFKLPKNEFTVPGEKTIYVQIHDIEKKVVAPEDITTLKNGLEIEYSDEIKANYENNELNVVSLILVNRDLIKNGEYIVNVFVDGVFSGNSSIKLR